MTLRLLVAVSLLIAAWSHAQADTPTRVAELEAELAAAKARIAELEAQLAEARGQTQTLQTEKQQLVEEKDRLTTLAGMNTQGELTNQAGARIQTTDAGLLSEQMRVKVSGGARGDHYLSFAAAPAPGSEHVVIYVQTRYSGDVYRDAQAMTLAFDDQTAAATVTDYKTVRRLSKAGNVSRNLDDETLTLTLSRSDAARLVATPGGQATGRIGSTMLQLTPEHLATLRAVLQRVSEKSCVDGGQ